jgi:hypothetical protein
MAGHRASGIGHTYRHEFLERKLVHCLKVLGQGVEGDIDGIVGAPEQYQQSLELEADNARAPKSVAKVTATSAQAREAVCSQGRSGKGKPRAIYTI